MVYYLNAELLCVVETVIWREGRSEVGWFSAKSSFNQTLTSPLELIPIMRSVTSKGPTFS